MTPAAVLQIIVNAQTGKASADLRRLNGELKTTGAHASSSAGAMGKFGKAAKVGGAAAAAAAVYGVYKSVKAFSDFESSFAEVRKTVDASPATFKKLETGLRNLAKQIPISVNELNELAGQAGALGIQSKDLIKFTKTAAELGIATDLSAEEASNALARLANIMGTQPKNFRRLGSTFVDLGNKGASTEKEIADMALRIAGAGRVLGLTEPQVLALSSSLANLGIRAEAGGSAISRVMLQMQDSVAKGAEPLENFAVVAGVTSERFKAIFEANPTKAIALFAAGLGKVNAEGGSTIDTLKSVELNEIRVRDTLLRVSGGTKDFTATQRIANEEWKRNTALTKEAQKRYATTAGQAQILKNKINDVFITVGKFLDPAVKGLLRTLNNLNFDEVSKEAERVANSLETFWKESGVTRAVVTESFRRIKAVVTDVIKGIIMFLRGWVQVIKGVVQVISGILTGDFSRVWKGVKNIFSGGARAVLGLLKALTAPIRGTVDGIGDALGKGFSAAWDKITEIFEDGRDAIIGVVNSIIDVINIIPGVPDIEKIGGSSSKFGKGGTGKWNPGKNAAPVGRYMGGPITKPMAIVGEEAPRHHEWVIATNPAYKRDNLNYWAQAGADLGVPGFAVGGLIGDVAGKAAGAVANVAGKGAGFFIDKLPLPDIPEPFAGLGPYMIDQVTGWIKDGFKSEKLGDLGSSIGNAGPLKQFNRTYPKHSLFETAGKTRFSEGLTARIARWAGLPGKTFAQIAHGESNFYPGIFGVDPGGTIGRGLWAITSGVGNDAMINRYGGPGAMFNPLVNAKVAKEIYEGAGRTISPWYGTKFVTGRKKGGPLMLPGDAGKGLQGTRNLWAGVGPSGLQSGIRNLAAYVMEKYPSLQVTSTTGGTHASNSLHYSGQAVDLAGSGMDAAAGWIKSSGLYRALAQGIHNPNLSVEGGSLVSPSYWGSSTWAGHANHIHLAATRPWSKAGFKDSSAGAGGDYELPEGIRRAREGKARKKARERQLRKLRQAVAEAKTDPAKNSKLWQLIKFWGRNGIFDKGERGHILDSVRDAASKVQTGESVKVLQNLAAYARNRGEITGKEPDNWRSLTKAIERAQEQGREMREKAVDRLQRKKERLRNKRLAKIAARAEMPGVMAGLDRMRGATDRNEETAGQLVTLEPENITDEYVGQERSSYEGVLNNLLKWRNEIVWARYFASGKMNEFEQQIGSIQSLKGKKSFHKQKYKLPALREGIKTLRELRDETLIGELEEIQGTGRSLEFVSSFPTTPVAGSWGGRVFEIQNTLRELGLKTSGETGEVTSTEGPDLSARVARLEELLREANQRNLVFERQKPIVDDYVSKNFAGMFARGGSIAAGQWGIAGEAGPEIIQGPAQVFSNSESAGMVGTQPIMVDVRVLDGAVDPKKIEVIATGAAVKVTKAQSKSATLRNPRAGRGV